LINRQGFIGCIQVTSWHLSYRTLFVCVIGCSLFYSG